MCAVTAGSTEIFALLTKGRNEAESHPDMLAVTFGGDTLLHIAARCDQTDLVVDILLVMGRGQRLPQNHSIRNDAGKGRNVSSASSTKGFTKPRQSIINRELAVEIQAEIAARFEDRRSDDLKSTSQKLRKLHEHNDVRQNEENCPLDDIRRELTDCETRLDSASRVDERLIH